jgi:LytS/YehU family sensor histidine kinase
MFVSYISEDGVVIAGCWAVFNGVFLAIVMYTNILVLYPRFYERGKKGLYFFWVAVLILGITPIRALVTWTIFYYYLMKVPDKLTYVWFLNSFLSTVFAYVMSLIFRIAIAYFTLKKVTEEIMLQKTQAELNLLKSQVQPHFLFNTLNNIYYESYRESPRTALLIERLSEIMRYFVDESPRQFVLLATEIRFLENYMALEQIRIRYGVHIRFVKDCNPEWKVPPMLLMTFVENIFKHGIDKTSPLNSVDISLKCEGSYLHFRTKNRLNPQEIEPHTGFGIKNLGERLCLLYGKDYELSTYSDEANFNAFLKFPLT